MTASDRESVEGGDGVTGLRELAEKATGTEWAVSGEIQGEAPAVVLHAGHLTDLLDTLDSLTAERDELRAALEGAEKALVAADRLLAGVRVLDFHSVSNLPDDPITLAVLDWSNAGIALAKARAALSEGGSK